MRRVSICKRSLQWRGGAVLLGVVGLTACSNGGVAGGGGNGARAAGAISVAPARRVGTAEGLQRLARGDTADMREAQADAPVAVYMVRLDQLRAYDGQTDPASLLVDLQTAFYPVRLRGEVRSSVELHKEAGIWETH